MKIIFIMYMPGHAGNFLTRLLSLSPETIVQLPKSQLREAITNSTVPHIERRVDLYKFDQVFKEHGTWQTFHRAWPDFADRDMLEQFDNIHQTKNKNVVYAIHPFEFWLFQKEIRSIKDAEFYNVTLSSKYATWVAQSMEKLKFKNRDNEKSLFVEYSTEYDMKSIDLTSMLDNQEGFEAEYIRICNDITLTPVQDQANELYQNWKKERVDHLLNKEINLEIVSRAPSDNFTYSLITSLLSNVNSDYEAHYIWTNPPVKFQEFFENITFSKPNVVIGIKDMLDMWKEYDFWIDQRQPGSQIIADCAVRNPDKNFVIVTSMENLTQELRDIPNIQVVYWGGDITNQSTAYPSITPVLNKNFNSDKTFINLNRHRRHHRSVIVSYLLGKGYDKFGQLSFLVPENNNEFLDAIFWRFGEQHQVQREIVINGYRTLKDQPREFFKDDYQIYTVAGNNDNVSNFTNKLSHYYQDSFVEIVSETTFCSPAYLVTEKTLNSIYGCNFPIILSGVGHVQHLRDMGFDMFDDIIDHSYDTMTDPFDRIFNAIDNNKRLITDPEYVKQQWLQSKPRFIKNIEVAKNMYDWYRTRIIEDFNNLQWK
jgi:hypothetical protein